MGWVGFVYNMLWVGLGLYFGGLGWVGFQQVDPRPCLNQLLTHAIVEVAKALGGSFKLVTLAPKKNCKRDDSTTQGNIKG